MGRLTSFSDFNPWGERSVGRDYLISGEKQTYTQYYGTHDYDSVTGLYYAKARWYQPEQKRFLSPDPMKGSVYDDQSGNAYVYCGNNPMTKIDVNGKVPEWLQKVGNKVKRNFLGWLEDITAKETVSYYEYVKCGVTRRGTIVTVEKHSFDDMNSVLSYYGGQLKIYYKSLDRGKIAFGAGGASLAGYAIAAYLGIEAVPLIITGLVCGGVGAGISGFATAFRGGTPEEAANASSDSFVINAFLGVFGNALSTATTASGPIKQYGTQVFGETTIESLLNLALGKGISKEDVLQSLLFNMIPIPGGSKSRPDVDSSITGSMIRNSDNLVPSKTAMNGSSGSGALKWNLQFFAKEGSSNYQYAPKNVGQTYRGHGTVVDDIPINKPTRIYHGNSADPYHYINRVAERYVSTSDIYSTIKNPTAVLSQWNGQRYLYISNNCAVVMNKNAELVTVWGRSDFGNMLEQILKEAH